jgi:cytoskeletal protein CcmA (bactofilin family)
MAGGRSLFTTSSAKTLEGPEEISAFLGKDTFFEGKMTFEGVFRLEGKFEGEIFESGILIIGETAIVKGKVGVNTIIINGLLEGEVFARGKVEIHSTGKFYGTLVTPALIINEGGIFEGECKMGGKPDRGDDLNVASRKVDHNPLVT